eukprot:1160037-Pelagomonas_calceolata.AAC.5
MPCPLSIEGGCNASIGHTYSKGCHANTGMCHGTGVQLLRHAAGRSADLACKVFSFLITLLHLKSVLRMPFMFCGSTLTTLIF